MQFLNYYSVFFNLFAMIVMTFFSYFRLKKNKQPDVFTKTYFICALVFFNLFIPLLFQLSYKENTFSYSQLLLCMLFGFFSCNILTLLCRILSFLKKQYFILSDSASFNKMKYGIIIFYVSTVLLYSWKPANIVEWVSVWYGTNYNLGLGSRFFLGSVLHFFSDGFVDKQTVASFCFYSLVLLLGLISYCLNKVIISVETRLRPGIIWLVLLYLFSPAYVLAYIEHLNFGRLEVYGYIISLIGMICFHGLKNIYVKYGILTFLSIISLAIYQGFIFLYYPILLLVMIYDILISQKEKIKKAILAAISVGISCITFLFFQFYTFVYAKTVDEFVQQVGLISNVAVSKKAVTYELFTSIEAIYLELMLPYIRTCLPYEQLFITLLLLFPLICIFILFYIYAAQKTKKTYFLKKPYIYFLMVNFALFPQFALNIDWGRWLIVLFNLLFFEMLYLIYLKDTGIMYALKICTIWVKKHMIAALLILLYISLLSYFDANSFFFAPAEQILKFFHFRTSVNFYI